jgi:hypothetical protein
VEPGGRLPSLQLDPMNDRASGYAGCNHFFASYQLRDASLHFGPVGTTRRICAEPAMAIEQAFLQALQRTRGWQVDGAQLLLLAADEVLMRFVAAAAQTSTADPTSFAFHSAVLEGEPVRLEHGEYRVPAAPGSASAITVRLTDHRAFARVEGKQTAVAVLVTSLGGTGSFFELALLRNGDGGWLNEDTVLLGDRVRVHAMAIEGDVVTLDMTIHAARDPMCCPTLKVVKSWRIRHGKLVEVSPRARGQGVTSAIYPGGSSARAPS